MELKTIHYNVEGSCATIMLSRPHKRNAWTGRMHTEYRHCLVLAEENPAVRVIVVTGDPEGKAFCAGADLGGLEKISEKGEYDAGIDDTIAKPGYGIAEEFDATFAYHFGLSKPTIAAINGAAAGVGLVLAAYCDLRFAVAGAKLTTAHGRFNFSPEYGLSWLLPRLIGITHANDLLLSSRVFTTDESMEMGFLNRLLSPEALLPAVYEYVENLASNCSPGSVRESKRQLYLDQHRSAASSVQESERLLDVMAKQDDYKEGIAAWMEKRPANWSDS